MCKTFQKDKENICKMTVTHQKFGIYQESIIKLQFLYVPRLLFSKKKKKGGRGHRYKLCHPNKP